MTFQGVPWFIGHTGAVHPPEIQRLLAYVASGGAEGVINNGDMAVRAFDTPGGSVHVATGGCVLLNRYTGGDAQSYVARNAGDHDVVIPGTSGSGRYDLLVVRVMDDQYAGDAPDDIANGPYVEPFLVQNVDSTTKTAAELNLGYPAIELALIHQPSSNSAVTNAMITNLASIARPRTQRVLFVANPSSVQSLTSTASDGVAFPTVSGTWTVDVPEWAQSAHIRADWALGAPAGNVSGTLWARIGLLAGTHVDAQAVGFNTPGASGLTRYPMFAADKVAIPSGLRGTNAALSLRGKASSAPGSAAIQVDTGGPVLLDIEFSESA